MIARDLTFQILQDVVQGPDSQKDTINFMLKLL